MGDQQQQQHEESAEDSIWGTLDGPTTIDISEAETKEDIRQKVWDFVEKHDLANFPRPVNNRIPNVKGAAVAGQKVPSLEEFRNASVIKVNPDKPQEEVRYQVLDHKKTLLVPTPRLRTGLLNLLDHPGGEADKEALRKLASRQGIDNHSKPLAMDTDIKIDVLVVGSVAVDKLGHRIGKGEGFADLEYAMGVTLGAITPETVVIATVHDCQLFDTLPEDLFLAHDMSVDIIVTPTLIHRVQDRLTKPTEIVWSMLTNQKFRKIPVLKQMRLKDQEAGKDVTLKKAPVDANGENKKYREKKEYEENDDENNVERSRKAKPKSKKMARDNDELFQFDDRPMLYIGKVPKDARVRDLKDAIIERGIKPKELRWKGFKGYAFIYFDKSQDVEEVYDALADLKIGDKVLDVQKEKYRDELSDEKREKHRDEQQVQKKERYNNREELLEKEEYRDD